MPERFVSQLVGHGPAGAWVFVPIPFDVLKVFGKKGQVPVTGSINGFPFQNSLRPNGDGTHAMHVNKDVQRGAGVKAGDTVEVILERDISERIVTIPPELARAFESAPQALDIFRSLAYSHQKEYAAWIDGAKQEKTRWVRAQKARDMILQRKKLR